MLLQTSEGGQTELKGLYADAVAAEIAYNRQLLRQLLARPQTTALPPAEFLASVLAEYERTAVGDTKHYAAAQVLHNVALAARTRNPMAPETLAAQVPFNR